MPPSDPQRADQLASRFGVALAGTPVRIRPGEPERVLPVPAALVGLLPAGGLRRGSVVQVEGSVALTLALLAEASGAGAWCALVGLPTVGLLAAGELGIDTDRLALIPEPGPDWAAVVAALLDAIDIVVLRAPSAPAPAQSRRLTARVRERGAVLISADPWQGAEVGLRPVDTSWYGVGSGYGRLTGYELEVESRGRGAASRPRRAQVRLGAPAGGGPVVPSPARSRAA